MRKLFSIAEVAADLASRKEAAAQARRDCASSPTADPPAQVYKEACACIAASFAPLGFRYAKSGPRFSRGQGPFTHVVSFQSSAQNVRGQYVALWIHANVFARGLKDWHMRREDPYPTDYIAGAQIGNLETPPAWAEWDLADPMQRDAAILDAIASIRRVVLPFFAHFQTCASALEFVQGGFRPGVEAKPAIELALWQDRRDVAQELLTRYFEQFPARHVEYLRLVNEYRATGIPEYRGSDVLDLAVATIKFGLTPPDIAA